MSKGAGVSVGVAGETEPEPSCAMAKGTRMAQQKKWRFTMNKVGKEERDERGRTSCSG